MPTPSLKILRPPNARWLSILRTLLINQSHIVVQRYAYAYVRSGFIHYCTALFLLGYGNTCFKTLEARFMSFWARI